MALVRQPPTDEQLAAYEKERNVRYLQAEAEARRKARMADPGRPELGEPQEHLTSLNQTLMQRLAIDAMNAQPREAQEPVSLANTKVVRSIDDLDTDTRRLLDEAITRRPKPKPAKKPPPKPIKKPATTSPMPLPPAAKPRYVPDSKEDLGYELLNRLADNFRSASDKDLDKALLELARDTLSGASIFIQSGLMDAPNAFDTFAKFVKLVPPKQRDEGAETETWIDQFRKKLRDDEEDEE